MKHKHYEMIVAKAENMELVVFCKGINDGCEWHEVKRFPNWQTNASYFLCLPQHKDDCLHWLNGGDVQDFFEEEWSDCASLEHATEVGGDNTLEFSMHHMFMNEEFNFRIAPKKEKRWIVVGGNSLHTMMYFSSHESASRYDTNGVDAQIIEIEIEVEV